MKKFMLIFVNFLTTIRIIGTILLLPIYLKFGAFASAIMAMFCYITDLFDGILARKFHVSTFFGAMYDSVADKLFTIANLAVIASITKIAIIPILAEIIIVVIQGVKFKKNINVQSNLVGKFKTLIMGITVVILYFAMSIESLTFLPSSFINTIHDFSESELFFLLFIPLNISEIFTVLSYLLLIKETNQNEKNEIPEIKIKFKKSKNIGDVWYNFKVLWLNNEFYEKYKDYGALKDIRKYIKDNR